jgi:hypothetical protein
MLTAYLEFSDPYPGHFEIMFRPTLASQVVLGRAAM